MSVRGLFAGAGSQPTGGAASYRYWRIYVQTSNGASNAGYREIELRDSAGGADLTTPSTPVIHSSYTSGNAGSDTVDNNISTGWVATLSSNQWCRYDLSTSKAVVQIAIYPSSTTTRSPKDFIVQGSSDGTDFTNVKSFTGVTDWTVDTWKIFDL